MVVSSPQSSITWIVLLLAGPVLPSLLYVPVSSSSLTSGLCVCPSSSWVDRRAQSLTLAITHLHYYCRLVSIQSPLRSRTLTWDMLVEQLHEGCENASLLAVSPYLLEHKQFRKASHSSLVASKSVLNNNNNDVMSALAPPLASSAQETPTVTAPLLHCKRWDHCRIIECSFSQIRHLNNMKLHPQVQPTQFHGIWSQV